VRWSGQTVLAVGGRFVYFTTGISTNSQFYRHDLETGGDAIVSDGTTHRRETVHWVSETGDRVLFSYRHPGTSMAFRDMAESAPRILFADVGTLEFVASDGATVVLKDQAAHTADTPTPPTSVLSRYRHDYRHDLTTQAWTFLFTAGDVVRSALPPAFNALSIHVSNPAQRP